ncbi:MAG: hypothetical protein AB1486_08930 [Planctomycetota bacterium]
MDGEPPVEVTLEEYLARLPDSEVDARARVEPFRAKTPTERLLALDRLVNGMRVLSAGRAPPRNPDEVDFWRHWMDPHFGKSR